MKLVLNTFWVILSVIWTLFILTIWLQLTTQANQLWNTSPVAYLAVLLPILFGPPALLYLIGWMIGKKVTSSQASSHS